MGKDVIYTNGVIAYREKFLLKDKLLKLCEGTAEDAFKSLNESGYGNGAEAASLYDYELLTAAEESALDDFIREYAPSRAEKAYLLAPRDFHNAKAILKAEYLGADAEKMLAPDGEIPISDLSVSLRSGDFSSLGKELGKTAKEAAELLKEEGASGAEIGGVFERGLYKYLAAVSSKNKVLKKLLAAKADMTNILTALRSSDKGYAEKMYVDGGRRTKKHLAPLFGDEREKAARCLDDTPYAAFAKKCFDAKEAGMPLTEAERLRDSYDADFFAPRKYELEKNQPFLYYVFRRRAENANVRIVFVCLLAGMREQDIKKRLRAF